MHPPVSGRARLILTINGADYYLRNLAKTTSRPIWRLTKVGGSDSYECTTSEIPHCTCADFVWRRETHGDYCKHIKALIAVYLLPGRYDAPKTVRSQEASHEAGDGIQADEGAKEKSGG